MGIKNAAPPLNVGPAFKCVVCPVGDVTAGVFHQLSNLVCHH